MIFLAMQHFNKFAVKLYFENSQLAINLDKLTEN
jgi:hypothetical protein